MEKQVIVQKNWEIWLKIEGLIRRWAEKKWNTNESKDVLSAGMELFVRRNRGDYGLLEHLRFGKLCCKQGARGLRAWSSRREYADGGEASALIAGPGAEAVDQNLLVSQIIEIINIKCCRELRIATNALLNGKAATLVEAAALAGTSEVVLSRHYRLLGRLLTGRARITSPRRSKNTHQLELFLQV